MTKPRFSKSEQGFFVLDSNLHVEYWSENMTKITGYPAEEMLGNDTFVKRYLHLLDKKKVFQKAFSENYDLRFDYYNPIWKKWFRIAIFPYKDSLFTTLVDVSEEKQKFSELLTVKNLKKHVLNSTSDLIWAIDRECRLLLGNESFFQIMKKTSGREIKKGDSVVEIGPESDLRVQRINDWQSAYDNALEGKTFALNFAISTPDRDEVYEVSFQPIVHDEEKVITGVACFGRNVTERTQHLQSIESQNSRLREISWLHSHQMRAPLSNILGLADLILNIDDFAEKQELVKLLHKAASQLDNIVLDIASKTKGV